jgi:hypothetical protein
MMMKDKIKEMFSADNIRRTLISAVFIGSLIYLMVTSFSFGALITVGLAGYVGYCWGYIRGENSVKIGMCPFTA